VFTLHRRRHDPAAVPAPRKLPTPGRGLGRVAGLVLAMAAIGAAFLSWGSVYAAVLGSDIGQHSPVLDVRGVEVNVAAAVLALLLDMVILGASLKYVAGVKAGRPAGAWRGLAHAGIAGTLIANVAAATSWADIGWHLIAPAVWSAVVEFTARDILGDMRAVRAVRPEVIPFRLWVTAPVESGRTTFRMLRTGQTLAAEVRLDADRRRAAADALRLELKAVEVDAGKRRRVRRLAGRRLWAGTVAPEDVFAAIGWSAEEGGDVRPQDADGILRAVLAAVRDPEPIQPILPIESVGSENRIESGGGLAATDRSSATIPGGRMGSVLPIPWQLAGDGSSRVVPIGGRSSDRDTGSAATEARAKDVKAIREAVRSGELAWPLVIDRVRETLHIAPKYATAAVKQIRAEGDPRESQRQEAEGREAAEDGEMTQQDGRTKTPQDPRQGAEMNELQDQTEEISEEFSA
jgi:hypothetical protein